MAIINNFSVLVVNVSVSRVLMSVVIFVITPDNTTSLFSGLLLRKLARDGKLQGISPDNEVVYEKI